MPGCGSAVRDPRSHDCHLDRAVSNRYLSRIHRRRIPLSYDRHSAHPGPTPVVQPGDPRFLLGMFHVSRDLESDHLAPLAASLARGRPLRRWAIQIPGRIDGARPARGLRRGQRRAAQLHRPNIRTAAPDPAATMSGDEAAGHLR